MGSALEWKVTFLLLAYWACVTYTQDSSSRDTYFLEDQGEFEFSRAWTDMTAPTSLKFTINGARDAYLAISPVPDLTDRHYLIGINSMTGCSWPYRAHIIGRNYVCVQDEYAVTNPIIASGEDVEFTLTLNDDGMTLTSDGGSGLSLSITGDNGRLCICCYIGIYSSFNSPNVQFSFTDTDDLIPKISLIGKDTIQEPAPDADEAASRAVDGDESTDINDNSCAITGVDSDATEAFWRVDLGDEYRIDQVVLFDAFGSTELCPDDTWTTFQQFCYKVVSTLATWDGTTPATTCSDGDLVSIHSQDELDFVAGLVTSDPLWIGLTDAGADEGTFTWTDGTPYDFTSGWDQFRPDSITDPLDDCVYIGTNGLWVDTHCDDAGVVNLGHICKIRQDPVLEGLNVYVGSCDHTGDIGYGDTPPLITNNAQCGLTISDMMADDLLGAVTVKCDPPRFGRYVYVHLPAGPDVLYLCEVQVFGKAVDCTDCCPVGWTMYDQHCYKAFDDPDTFDNIVATAAPTCPPGSDLVSIHSQEEQDFVSTFVSSDPLWIGLNDKTAEGTFVWTDGSTLVFTNWATATGSPQTGSGANDDDDCVYLGTDGLWVDGDCSNSGTDSYGYICKQPRDLNRRGLPLIRFTQREETVAEDVNELVVEIVLEYIGQADFPPTCYRFNVSTTPDSAVAVDDFTAVNETLYAFTADDSKTQTCSGGASYCHEIRIPISDDLVCEDLEHFDVEFTNVVGLDVESVSNNPLRVAIQDNDGCFELARNTYTVSEPSSLPLIHKWINVTVLFKACDGELPVNTTGSVKFSTVPIDATPGKDYEIYNGHVVEFEAGVRSINVPVGITDDRITEETETFRAVLSSPGETNHHLCEPSEAVITILDSDHTCAISESSYNVLESAGTLEVTVTCTDIPDDDPSVGLSAVSVTAQAGSDFVLRDTSVDIDDDTNTATFFIDIINDSILENTETLHLYLLTGDDVISGDPVPVTITDDEAGYSLARPTYSFNEGGNAQSFYVIVERDGYLDQTGSVWIRTKVEDTGNAEPADTDDFFSINEQVQFASGDEEAEVHFQIINDNNPEAFTESFVVELYNPTNGYIDEVNDRAEIFIFDDDAPIADGRYFYLGEEEYNVLESTEELRVTVYRTDAQYHGSVILSTGHYSTGGAERDVDYVQLNALLNFEPGETSKTATVQIRGDDNFIEGPKKFFVTLDFPLGGKIGSPGTADVNIIDDDVTLSFIETEYAALEGDGSILIPVRRRGYMGPVSFDVQVPTARPGNAEEGEDFIAPATATFVEGESEAFVSVTIIDDDDDEATTESFALELVEPLNGQVVEPDRTSVVIFDNDEEGDGADGDDGDALDSTAITFIGLGVAFGLLALIGLIACCFICSRIANANRLNSLARYPAPTPVEYKGPGPYPVGREVVSPYERRGPYYLS